MTALFYMPVDHEHCDQHSPKPQLIVRERDRKPQLRRVPFRNTWPGALLTNHLLFFCEGICSDSWSAGRTALTYTPLPHLNAPRRCLRQPTFFRGPVKCHLSSIFWVYAEQFAFELPRIMRVMYIDTLDAFNISVLSIFILMCILLWS